jgi:phosphatidylinositol alpha-mannosyltransferase
MTEAGVEGNVFDCLHICLVSQSYLPYHGGITEHVWHLASALTQRGHRVTLLTGRPLSCREADEPDPPGVEVLRIGRTLRVPSNGARACVTIGTRWGYQVARRLRHPPDLVHIQSPLEPFLPLWALRHLPGTKIGTFHTAGEQVHWGYRRFAPCLKPFARRLARRIAVSRQAAGYAARHFPGRYTVIPNGVDLKRFRPPEGRGESCRKLCQRILYVGRLDPRKGLQTLLEAFGHLYHGRCARRCGQAAARRKLELVIVGDGPLGRQLQRRARQLDLPVSFQGIVSRGDLARCYREADLFVAPSVDGESFGVSLLEALASGLPVVAADIDGYRETLAGSRAAVGFRPGAAEDLSRHLADLLDDSAARESMGRCALRFVRRFSWERIAGEVERAYREAVMEDRSATRPGPSAAVLFGRRLPQDPQGFSAAIRAKPRKVSASSTS